MRMLRLAIAIALTGCFGETATAKADGGMVKPAMYVNGTDTTAQLFVYCPNEKDGLHVAYLTENDQWQDLGKMLSSDYGPWGSDKRMIDLSVARAGDGSWRAVWAVNKIAPCFAVAYSKDLCFWRPQDYPMVSVKDVRRPIVFPMEDGTCDIYFTSDKGKRYVMAERDFRHFSKDEPSAIGDDAWIKDTATIGGKLLKGNSFEVELSALSKVIAYTQWQKNENKLNAESMQDDAETFKGLSGVNATIAVDINRQKAISDKLVGIFFEDISYAADGGLYAELVQNRDFEYSSADRGGWNATTAWRSSKQINIKSDRPLSDNNKHYAVMSADEQLINSGFDGIADTGSVYVFSVFARNIDAKKKKMTVALVDKDGNPLAEQSFKVTSADWQKYSLKLDTRKAKRTERLTQANLVLTAQKEGNVAVDMVSLFPEETFMGRENGLRKDLAQKIADLKPKFMRFPGGCMSHGQGIDNIYHWQETIGKLQDRKPEMNIWNYHQTRGLGFYEYFQFCEDIGAEPLPVLSAGVPCQNSQPNAAGMAGQQGGIDMKDMPAYCEELCNLIEWANGNPATSKWAKMRAEAGHPAPFNLKYIGVGNEDLISTAFEERYLMICKAIKAKYPEIKVIGTVGPFHYPSSDYVEGWEVAKANKQYIDAVDEHYYESTGWFLNHQDYYDNYDRTAPKVYVGEYACHVRGRKSNVEAALAEAIHLTTCERNGDIVAMTSYAPMLSNVKHQNWHPNMIYFNNATSWITPTYETQRLYSNNAGDKYIATSVNIDIKLAKDRNANSNGHANLVKNRIAATVVKDAKTGSTILKVVNALPTTTNATISGIAIPAGAHIEGFHGKVMDEQVTTIKQTFNGGNTLTLAPYSLYIIRW